MLLTPEQVQQVAKIIEKHHSAFIVSAIGPEAVPPEVLQELEKQGLIEEHLNSIEQSYLYGQLLGILQNQAVAKMSFPEFQKYVRKNPIPLSDVERRAVQFAQIAAASYVRGLGNKVSQQTGQLMIEADQQLRTKLESVIRDKTAENIAKRETAKQLKSDLGWASEDWTRDWDRIAVTEKQTAMQQGLSAHILKRYGPKALVAKRPMPDACKRCRELHLGPDGNPRIFPLQVLIANGTNVGKKAAEWQAVVGTIHPHCACQLLHIPTGWGFNEEGELVPGGSGGKVYKSGADLSLAILREEDLQKSILSDDPLVYLWGMPIRIENTIGSERTWHTQDGGTDSMIMLHAYGEIVGTEGMDGDPLDVFIGPDPESEMVYVIEQQNPDTGLWDEHKCMLGFPNQHMAESAYRRHYDRPEEFFLATNTMTLDAFQRWAGATRVPSMPQKPGLRLVVPLNKAQVPAHVGAADSPAGNRSPSPGTAANYLVETPKRQVPEKGDPPGMDPNDMLRDPEDEERQALKRDKEIYTVTEPLRIVRPIELPEAALTGQDSAREGTEERRRYVIGNAAKIAQRPQDKAELEKSIPAVIAEGPRGGQIIGWKGNKPIYLSKTGGQDEQSTGWLERFISHFKGKIREHGEDASSIMVKFPKDKAQPLFHLKEHFQLPGEVQHGGQNVMLKVSKADFQKVEQADFADFFASKTAPVEKTSAPKGEVTFAPENIERSADIELYPKDKIQVPKVLGNFIRQGTAVTYQGKDGKLAGTDQFGNPIVEVEGAGGKKSFHFAKKWKDISAQGDIGPKGYRASTADLPEKCFVKPDARQQKLLDEMSKVKVVAEHQAGEYVDWLWEHGREAYVVGGAVRDLIASTAPGVTVSDESIRKALLDVDIVTTAEAPLLIKCLQQVAADLPAEVSIDDEIKAPYWSIVRATKIGEGLDLASMVSFTTGDGAQHTNPANGKYCPNIRVDHQMDKDIIRRDFTANCLYYDPKNKIIVDPSGQGIADAQNHVLRLPIPIKDMPKNNALSCRYYKFRMRGWIPDKDTHDQCVAHFEETFKHLSIPNRAGVLLRTVAGKGGTPEENLAKLKAIMTEDGVGHLYAEYIGKVEGQILEILHATLEKRAKQKKESKALVAKLLGKGGKQ